MHICHTKCNKVPCEADGRLADEEISHLSRNLKVITVFARTCHRTYSEPHEFIRPLYSIFLYAYFKFVS